MLAGETNSRRREPIPFLNLKQLAALFAPVCPACHQQRSLRLKKERASRYYGHGGGGGPFKNFELIVVAPPSWGRVRRIILLYVPLVKYKLYKKEVLTGTQ